METRLYTVRHKGSGEIRAIADRFDRFDWFDLAPPPLWAVWHGLWITLAALVALAALWSPLALAPVVSGIAAILGFEGGAVRRAELGPRRWREAGVVEARSPEGAEELFLRGEAA
ncbi:MAG: hypothetical protein IID49_04805 [Proteobacteria bacterium]|nr:hypothetical protein [Pseudomonadota bacterium]